ncbi:MAG TPA: pyrroloquinoline quinone biosynthesis protein PqqB [Phycisphaerae bacterium]|nr:pyrroloquinoline quinone biosynthesis protein PqqB [Phycisphaerae bacterium]
MKVRILGAAAGGGFPQWNCFCEVCEAARRSPPAAKPRMQSCIGISSDSKKWFVINAPPDLARQIASFNYHPPANAKRGTALEGIMLTNADLDHTLGLFLLREGQNLNVWATPVIKNLLCKNLRIDAVLGSYCGINFHTPPAVPVELHYSDGSPSSLLMGAIEVSGHAPRYTAGEAVDGITTIGYRIVDPKTGGRLVCLPDIASFNHQVRHELQNADVVLVDGTFWSDDELIRTGTGSLRARDMGHLPVGDAGGILENVSHLKAKHKIFIHINNTNPMLLENSPQRKAVEQAGCVVGWDSMEIEI